MRIRLVAKPGDLSPYMHNILDTIDHECFPEDPLYNKIGCYWWVVYDCGLPIAFGGLKKVDSDTVFLCRVGVRVHARGRGLQKRLIRTRMNYIKNNMEEINEAITYTITENPASSNSLIAEGFKLYVPESPWYEDEDVLYWFPSHDPI